MTVRERARPMPRRVRAFEETQQATPLLLRALLGRNLAPTHQEHDDMADALWDGDPAMDQLVQWMNKSDARQARAQFDQAITHGLRAVQDCPEPLRLFMEKVETPPAWVDFDLIDDGARFIHSTGLAASYVLRDLALMGGYLLSGANQSLVLTGALNKGAARRFAETSKWWIDCTDIGGLQRFSEGFKSTLHVRMVHALLRRNLAARDDWDDSQWGRPISQTDMVATYLGFSVVMLAGLRKMGLPITPHESRAVMHLWKYACWLMGVDERWLVDSERDGIVRLHHAVLTQSRADWTSRELGSALAREPLERHFAVLEPLQRKWAYHAHLSVSRYFLNKQKMRKLGLPDNVLPWYPWLTLGPRFAMYTSRRLLPGLRKGQQKAGRKAQLRRVAQLFGDARQDLIRPDTHVASNSAFS